MWHTNSKIFKIIKAVSNKDNNFTINLKDYYKTIKCDKTKIKVYCIPNKIQTMDFDSGYEIKIETSDILKDYYYHIYMTSKGIISSPKTIVYKSFNGNEVSQSYTYEYTINPNCTYVDFNFVSHYVQADRPHKDNKFFLYLDDVLIDKIYVDAYYMFYTYNKKLYPDKNKSHKFKIVSQAISTEGRGMEEFYIYTLVAQYLEYFTDKDAEINCFFVLEEA